MNTDTHLDFISAFIFIGVFQGVILSFFLIFKSQTNIKANKFQGLLLLTLTLCILEQFLNITGYITRILVITNYSEALNLVIGPFLYLFVKRSINNSDKKRDWLHFVIAGIYACYLVFDLIQPLDVKYNSYVYSMHPDWPERIVHMKIPNDPLHIKKYLNLATGIQLMYYIFLSFRLIVKKGRQSGESIFRTDNEMLRLLRNMILHIAIILSIFIIVKLCFINDLGDYYIGVYVSFFILLTTLRVMNDSTYFDRSATFMDISLPKYSKSSLTEADKVAILDEIVSELKTRHYYSDNLASLSDLARKIGRSAHHVSQVINEKLDLSFFELLASYRIEEAKRLLTDEKNKNLTIEEISEQVGYNSKTAFNNAFKKLTGKTPSEFRRSVIS